MKKKLIEVALPLEAINRESAREKSIRQGHPSTLHLWWARRPLAACRAVLFASIVDDPSSLPEQFPTEADQDVERKRLFAILEELVRWENSNNPAVLQRVHREILRATNGQPPPVYDPFCGGGSIPLEAQRLGLESFGSDLNPVAVLITKALIEIPPKFVGQPPSNPIDRNALSGHGMWVGAAGLGSDIRYYAQWMRDRADERIGHLYPRVTLDNGEDGKLIACLWARTVNCPNPACGARMPLMRTFSLCTKKGKETWAEPIIDSNTKSIKYAIRTGSGRVPEPPKLGRGAKFRCLVCNTIVPDQHIKDEGASGRMQAQMLAVVAEGTHGRVYRSPDAVHENASNVLPPQDVPLEELANDPRNLWCIPYGLRTFSDLFTSRQLVALSTFSALVSEARLQALADGAPLERADAIGIYLGLSVSRLANRTSTACFWDQAGENVQQVFARQAIPMTWDYVEGNPLSSSTGNFLGQVDYLARVVEASPVGKEGHCQQLDATQASLHSGAIYSTDPPYYDNISYSDLSDYFYVWLKRALFAQLPSLFSTLVTPKEAELIAHPYRKGSKENAQHFFQAGFERTFESIRKVHNRDFPMTIYYAFKQSEGEAELGSDSVSISTGWETMLAGIIKAGFQVTATWPMRTELTTNLKKSVGALASCIVLACRVRPDTASITTRKDLLSQLKKDLPNALRNLQKGNVAPVDMAQAAIGPGMGVFSRYTKVLEANGESMSVRTALGLINQTLDEVLSEQESDFDPDTRWALQWFEQFQFNEGLFGQAETLASAKAVSIQGLQEAGILLARAGKVRLLTRDELDQAWDPTTDGRLTIWEITQHLIKTLETRGETDAARLKAKLGGAAEAARELAYRLYSLCERKGWAQEAGAYNNLVVRWPDLRAEEFELS